ncbi:MAG: glycine cleavage system aminomethyltransferase GcvT [Polyangiaceae bacterium]|nr:glycine cleavage system aminomethyltransferase GcvT [Polyangiaceae bacterium]MCW5790755.1 glycine cleavage system aminomethyltransferase GcvT [Polyangiaceae bacterium]
MTSLRATPLTLRHRALGARLVPFAGYEMPIQYSGIVAEHQAVRERAGLFDVSHMGELRVTGGAALSEVNHLITNDLTRAADGQALYTCCLREDGGILDDLIVYRTAEDDVLIVCNASNYEKILAHVSQHVKRATLSDETEATALIALQGPRALQILSDAGLGVDPSSIRPFRFQRAELAGAQATVARTGYTGEDGVELFCAAADAPRLWDALMAAGAPHGLLPCGLGARDTLRLEARLSLYGNELSEETHPLEAGLGWTVKLDKPDFIGKAALVALGGAEPQRSLIGFECTSRGIARGGYPVMQDGAQVGIVTSGGPAPTLGKNIGLAYVPPALSAIGSALSIDARGRLVDAVVVKTPFYKRPAPRAPTSKPS